jgi:formylglycine-generating enzyme required for sulfatase activity
VKGGAAAAIVAGAIGVALLAGALRRGKDEGARCGPGFVPRAARCMPSPGACPAPLLLRAGACDAPDVRVLVPAASIALGASDWEATGVRARTIHVDAFQIDAFEVTLGHWREHEDAAPPDDRARAASGMTRAEAEAYCAGRGGRLPTEDEWIAAAVSAAEPAHRYPWGDTGAVCRRAAWGLADGPCARGAEGPDTVGAHPDGDTPLGLHDLAGNVAEWVAPAPGDDDRLGSARGGSWRSELASELRVWSKLDLRADARDPRVGLRCAYPP